MRITKTAKTTTHKSLNVCSIILEIVFPEQVLDVEEGSWEAFSGHSVGERKPFWSTQSAPRLTLAHPQGCLFPAIEWGSAKTPRSQPRGPWHEVTLVLWAKMAPRGSPLRARSKQRNKETEKLRNREIEKLGEMGRMERN